MLSGPADTGKTLACLYGINQMCWRYPGAQVLIVRKAQTDLYGSVVQTYQRKILKSSDNIRAYGGDLKPTRFIYPNGSEIWLGGMDKDTKVLSQERDIIYVNQAEELSPKDWEMLGTRATGRAGNIPFAFLLGDCNPAAPTHWIQTKNKNKQLTFLEVTHQDNPELYDQGKGDWTAEGKRRRAALERRLTGARKLRLYHGLWAAPEGAIYDVFDETKHKVRAFDINQAGMFWPRYVGVDPLGAYVAAVFVAVDPVTGIHNVYREYYEPFGVTTVKHAENILHLAGYRPDGSPASIHAEPVHAWIGGGPSERQQREDFKGAGLPLLEPPITDVWAGIDRVYSLMANFKMVVHDSCENLLNEIGAYKRIERDGQPTDKIENKEQFHLLDALRYVEAFIESGHEPATSEDINKLESVDMSDAFWR